MVVPARSGLLRRPFFCDVAVSANFLGENWNVAFIFGPNVRCRIGQLSVASVETQEKPVRQAAVGSAGGL